MPTVLGQNPTTSSGQGFPVRPVRIVTSAVGGLNDFASRLIAQGLSVSIGEQVIVDNRGVSSIDIVAKAAPDGHTVLCFANNFWLLPFMQDNVSYDPVRDFVPLTLAVTAPNLLAVHPSLPVNTVKQLIALAKARPGELNYGVGAAGGSPHLAAELFKSMARVDIMRIDYKGSGPSLTGLIAGEIQLMFATPGSVVPQVKAGKLKALAITSAQPSALTPGLPTVSASGLPGYEAIAVIALFAPAKTPTAIVNRLNQEMIRVLGRPEVKEKFINVGSEVVGSTPDELNTMMKTEIDKWGKLIKDAGIRGGG